MEAEVYKAALKEWYWLVIIGALVAVAFAPSLLKGKCPACGKKSLRSVEISDGLRGELQEPHSGSFLTFFRCDRCAARFRRDRTGPLEDASDARWQAVFEPSDPSQI